MGNHGKEGRHTPKPEGGTVRNRVLAVVIASGAFAAVGQPLAMAAEAGQGIPGQVGPPTTKHDLRDAVNGTSQRPARVQLLDPLPATSSLAEVRKLQKSKAIQQARAAADEATRKAAEVAEAQRNLAEQEAKTAQQEAKAAQQEVKAALNEATAAVEKARG